MKLPFLNICITRTDWESKYHEERAYNVAKGLCEHETFTDKQGKIRYKHNGRFAPDDRSQFKKTHDALRAEAIAREFEGVPDWGDLKTAYRNEEFGR